MYPHRRNPNSEHRQLQGCTKLKSLLHLKKHGGPLVLLVVVALFLLSHVLRSPGTFGMSNTDNEGTLWWIWTKCQGYSVNGLLTRVGWPTGFDTRDFATFNLVDEFRASAARLGRCSPETVTSIFSLFPVVALFLNLATAYLLGWKLFRNRLWALILAITGIATSQILLATRTSLANNLLAPGLLSLIFALSFFELGKQRHALLSALFLSTQMLCNAYNGAMFFIVLIVFALAWKSEIRFRQWIVFPGILLLGCFVGLLPLARTQLFLITDTARRDLIRPVNLEAEVVNPQILLSRNYSWFNSLLQGKLPSPEAGWLSVFVLLLTVLAVVGPFSSKISARTRRLAVGSSAASLLIVLIACDVPGGEPFRLIYSLLGSPFRGVSNFLKIVPLLLTIGGLSILREISQRRSEDRQVQPWLSVVLILLCGLNLWDSVPTSPSFTQRTSLIDAAQFYRSLPDSRKDDVVAHFPDYTYQPEWGLPLRFIQISQMYTDEILANGRDFSRLHTKSSALPYPVNRRALMNLRSRGVTRVILHRNLIDSLNLYESVRFLESLGLEGVRYRAHQSSTEPEILKALDVVVFDISGIQQMNSPWILNR